MNFLYIRDIDTFSFHVSRRKGSICEAGHVCSVKKGANLFPRQPRPVERRLGWRQEEGQSVQVKHKLFSNHVTFFLSRATQRQIHFIFIPLIRIEECVCRTRIHANSNLCCGAEI